MPEYASYERKRQQSPLTPGGVIGTEDGNGGKYYGGSGVRDASTLERALPEYGDVVVLYMLPPQQGHL